MARGETSIAKKALTLGLVPAFSVLVVVSTALFIASFMAVQRSLARDMDALTAVVRDNVSASLAFNDPATATEILSALRAKQNVDGVCVFNVDGALFAYYGMKPGFECEPALDAAPRDTALLTRVSPVTVGERRVGLVQLVGNDSEVFDWLVVQGVVTVGALAIGALIAIVLTRRMHRGITQPVLALAIAARQVTATGDYTVRATKSTDDEIGALADAFNRMLDQIQQHLRLKDEFLAVLSHELRTPLNAILGWVHILRTTKPEGERLERALASVDRNARAQARLVEDLLDVSRIVTGRLELKREVVDLRDVVSAALDNVAPEAAQSPVDLSVDVPPTPCLVGGDPDRLRQAVANLISNGLKFTAAGGNVTLRIAEAPEAFTITVSDTGIGISAEFLPYVFDQFRQSDASPTREHGGLGLGLSIVKEIVGLHGGTVTAASDGEGKGATFVVRLPRLVAA